MWSYDEIKDCDIITPTHIIKRVDGKDKQMYYNDEIMAVPEKLEKYNCDCCNFNTPNRKDYRRHLGTKKHQTKFEKPDTRYCNRITFSKVEYKEEVEDKNNENRIYICDRCNKSYSVYKSYWSHVKLCKLHKPHQDVTGNTDTDNYDENNTSSDDEEKDDKIKELYAVKGVAIFDLFKQNQEFQKLMIQQNKELNEKLRELSEQNKEHSNRIEDIANKEHIVYNTNNHFNLNLFLNVYCKDAMNLSDFLRSIEVQLHELEYMGKHGYVAGITKIITSRLSAMDVCKRPIHCSDLRREVIHIRENNEWIKDIDGEKTRAFVYNVNIINYKSVGKWMIAHPKCEVLDTPEYNQWFSIATQSVNPGEGKENRNNMIFKNILKFCHIDKHAFRMLNIENI